jgi:YVTN family beta-propeller protein
MTTRISWMAMLAAAGGAAGASLGGCDSGGDDGPPTGNGPPVLARPSKSETVAITGNDKFVAMVNPETGSISVFDTATDTRIASVKTGGEPSSSAIGPDDDTAYAANRPPPGRRRATSSPT